MNLIIFILVYPLILMLSILPMRVLYFFSDILFLLVYHVIGYRKDVVYNNMKLSYPDKHDKELKELTKKSLAHFCDFIFETIKTFNISKKELNKRYVIENIEVVNDIEAKGKSFICLGFHYGNWEWMSHFITSQTNLYPASIYAPIKNKYLDNAIKRSRASVGTNLVSKNETVSTIEKMVSNNVKAGYGLLSDQSPRLEKTRYWGEFLGQFIPVINAPEFLAKKYDFAVVNLLTTRVKRGYYTAKFVLLAENPNDFAENEITNAYLKSTTEHIKKAPEFYLWTHKRFKHLGKHQEWLDKYKRN